MWFEINVSLHGKHFFATAERSIATQEKLAEVWKTFTEKFPASEGFSFTATKWQQVGEKVGFSEGA